MPRRRKLPERVKIELPTELAELYETPILDMLLPPAQRRAGEKVIKWIKKNGRLYPDELSQLAENEAEYKAAQRAISKLLALGLLGRGAEGSYIFRETGTLEARLLVLVEKIKALKGA